jgi:hypothetical protein
MNPAEPTPTDLALILAELHRTAGPDSRVTIYASHNNKYRYPLQISISPDSTHSSVDRTTKATSWAGMIEQARVIAREVGTQARAGDIEYDSWAIGSAGG